MICAAVALGSNLEDPSGQVKQAFQELDALPQTSLVKTSRLYRSEPVGPAGQPDYCNAVALLNTALTPEALLARLHGIENAHDRRRAVRWGPRTLDLDLLCHAGHVREGPELFLPHPRIAERAFVLEPWSEIAPDQEVPGLGIVSALRDRVSLAGLRLWEDAT